MTTSKAVERDRARRPIATHERVLGATALSILDRASSLGFLGDPNALPLVRYRIDPVRFCADVLGVQLTPEQEAILEAIRDNRRVAVSGGRKVGKDFVLACAALWFFACFPNARVRFTAVKAEQVEDVFWLEVRQRLSEHGRCLECKRRSPIGIRPCTHSVILTEETPHLARTGLRIGFHELVGYTSREAEGAAGVSGGYQLYIVDEASAVEDTLIGAIEGNLLGCVVGRIVLISNPTRSSGQFFRAFHEEEAQWKTFYLSSIEIARKYGSRIPGIATIEEIDAIVEKYGGDSDFVQVHIHGRFVKNAQGLIFDIHSIEQAILRWPTALSEQGALYLGIDVAGDAGTGDESAFAARIEKRVLSLHARRGLSPEAHLEEALALVQRHRIYDEQLAIVVVDRGGGPGAKVWGVFTAYLTSQWKKPPFELIGVDSSRKAQRDPKAYRLVRDELAANFADWVRAGGSFPADAMLARELNEFRWIEQRIAAANTLVDKRTMRTKLGRSPDRADAVMLSCWGERHWRPATATEPATIESLEHGAAGDVYDDASDAQRSMRDILMQGPGRGR